MLQTLPCGALSVVVVSIWAMAGCSVVDTSSQPTTVAAVSGRMSVGIFGERGVYDESAWIAFLRDYPLTVTRIDMISSPLSDTTLASFDIVILERLSRPFDASEAASVASWVHAGGSLVSLAGFVNNETDGSQQNSLLAALPVQYVQGYIALTPSVAYVTNFSTHPTMVGLTSLPFWGGYRVALRGACDGPSQVVASYEDAPVGVACTHGKGRLFIWGDEWVEYSSQWRPGNDAPRFWKNVIDWLGHRI